jgi:hypothetical protein
MCVCVFVFLYLCAYARYLQLGRALAIPLSLRLTSKTMLLINMVTSALAVAVMLTSTADGVLWAGTVVFGLGMASTYPTVLTLVETYVNLSGKVRARAQIHGHKHTTTQSDTETHVRACRANERAHVCVYVRIHKLVHSCL